VIADLGNAAPVEHHDAIGVLDGGQAMGDDEGGAALAQGVERLLDLAFRLGVKRRGRFVQNQDRRILQQGAGDGDALALAADSRAPFSPIRVSRPSAIPG